MGLFKTLMNKGRYTLAQLDKRLKDCITDQHLAILDSEKEIKKITERIVELDVQKNLSIKQIENIKGQISHYLSITKEAIEKNNDDDAREFLRIKNEYSNNLVIYEKTLLSLEKMITQLETYRDKLSKKIEKAKANITILEARRDIAKSRKRIAKLSLGFNSGVTNDLADMSTLDLEISKIEFEADAWENEANKETSKEKLEEKYRPKESNIEEELSKLKEEVSSKK